MNSELKSQTISSVGWSAINNMANHLVTFVVGIVLARLLSPDDFGLLGLTAIFTVVCEALINGGFSAALVRKVDASVEDYATVFAVNFVNALILYAVIFFCAPQIAVFFGREELSALIRVASFGMVIGSISIVQMARVTKQLNFKLQAKISFISSFTSGVVGISMAVMGLGVWSLIIQKLSYTTLMTTLLCIANRWIPYLRFSKACFKSLFGFGWKIMVSDVLNTIWGEISHVVVGKFYSPASLGQYTRASHFNYLFSGNLTDIIQRVTFPVLSSIQGEKPRLLSAYRKIIKITIFISSIVLLFAAAISEPLIYCLIGPKWYEASAFLPLMCITGTVFMLVAVNINILKVVGRSDLLLWLTIVHKLLASISLVIGIYMGIIPMLLANFAVMVITYTLYAFLSGRGIGYGIANQLKDVIPSYILGFVVAALVYFLKYLPVSNWVILPLQVATAIIVVILLCENLQMEEYRELKGIVVPYFRKYFFHGK